SFETRLRVRDNSPQAVERLFLNHSSLEFTKWSFEAVSAGPVLVDEVRTVGCTGNINKGCQRKESIEVVICVNLLRRDEHLWTNIAVPFVNRNMIDGDYRLESKLNLGPDHHFFQ